MKKYNVGIIGSKGIVGNQIRKVLKKKKFPINKLFLFDLTEDNETIKMNELYYKNLDIVFFAAGNDVSKKYAPIAIENNIFVIDNSSFFRMDSTVPLIIPEINGNLLNKKNKLISNPNCSTIQLCEGIFPLYKKYGIKKIIVSTYQAVSGAGKEGLQELENQVINYVNKEKIISKIFDYQIFNNLIPQIDTYDNGYYKEETKVINETKKIFDDYNLKIDCTAVRVPVKRAHSESVTLDLIKPFTKIEDIIEEYNKYNLMVHKEYPMPLFVENDYLTHVGRIRKNEVFKNGVSLWIVADQIIKGAALNAVDIGLYLIKEGLL